MIIEFNSLQIVSLIYIFSLMIVCFFRKKSNFIDDFLYKFLLVITVLVLFFSAMSGYDIQSNILLSINNFYFLTLFIWLILFFSYILLRMSSVKYDSLKKMVRQHSLIITFFVCISLIFLVLLILYQFGSFNSYFGTLSFISQINILCFFSLGYAFYVLLILFIKNVKKFNRKNLPIIFSILLLNFIAYIQIRNSSLDIIDIGVTLLVLFQYFVLENPDAKQIEELNLLRIKAEEANMAKTSFLANISHEIRTPMNVIIGLSESMLDENIPKEFHDDIKSINEAGTILLEIVNNILDITKIEEGKIVINNSSYSLADIIARLSDMIKISLSTKPVKFTVETIGKIPNLLMGDGVKVYQVLLNVLSNSVKYTKEGSIKLVIESVIFGNKDILTFKIIDTGVGIKKADSVKLFEKFERLGQDETGIQGTGLGLSITKKLVDLMGGKISFNSVYQEGTVFTIVLEQEIVDKSTIDLATYKGSKNAVENYFDGSKYKILLVDDNDLNLRVTEKMLQKYNLNVTSVKSGVECLNYTRNNVYDLIFMDHMMPDMDGIHTLYNLKKRANGFDTPVVVLTANAIQGTKQMYFREGFCDYLSKPIDQVELDRILREQLKIDVQDVDK